MKTTTLKVPNGKLLKVFLDVSENKIKEIKITGDFFVHPEEAIEELEKVLVGVGLEQVESVVTGFFAHNKVEMVGVDKEHIVKSITQSI